MISELSEWLANGLGDLHLNAITLIIFVWFANKVMEKQQDATLIHNEQINKMVASNIELAESLAEIAFEIREMKEELKVIRGALGDLSIDAEERTGE